MFSFKIIENNYFYIKEKNNLNDLITKKTIKNVCLQRIKQNKSFKFTFYESQILTLEF